jgi:hypothetical protein
VGSSHASLNGRRGPVIPRAVLPGIALALLVVTATPLLPCPPVPAQLTSFSPAAQVAPANSSPVSNFSAAIGRLVELVGVAGSGVLALVWTRVAMSWFSNDITKKVQAKDRARDALIGTLLFVAAISGLIWGLAHWVLTGT